jgi:subtilisin family serine protease
MQSYNKSTQFISLFSLFLLTFVSSLASINAQAIDPIRNEGFNLSSIAINNANDSQPTLIKVDLSQNYDSEDKEAIMDELANIADIKIDYTLTNLDSFVTTINNDQLFRLKNQSIVSMATAYKSFSAPLNIQQDSKSLETLIMSDYDKNTIPKYHQAIGITDTNSKNGMTGKGQAVAIIDTGVDFTQPELKGSSITEACFSDVSKEYGIKSYSVCPNGKNSQIGFGASKPCSETDAIGCSHGTHVAGIIAGRKTARNHAGIAPEAGLISVNVFHIIENEARCNPQNTSKLKKDTALVSKCIYTSNLAYLKGIDFVIEQSKATPVAALNMSLGSNETKNDDCNDADTPNFQSVIKNNISLVIASGNGGDKNLMSHPACQSKVLSVGAYDEETKTDAFFSNVSPKTSLFATGSSIESVGYTMSGTSMATPMVSGTIALLRQEGLTDVDDIRSNLIDNGSGFKSDTTMNGKLINVSKSLRAVGLKPKEVTKAKPIESKTETKPEIKIAPKPLTPSAKCTTGQPGWCAKYYNNKTLTGKPVVTKAIPALNTYNQRLAAEKGVYADKFSAIYTAKFKIKYGEFETFRYNFDDGVKVTLTYQGEDYIIIDEWKNQPPKSKVYSEFLEPGDYNIKVEYYDNLLGSTRMLDIIDSKNQLVQFSNI